MELVIKQYIVSLVGRVLLLHYWAVLPEVLEYAHSMQLPINCHFTDQKGDSHGLETGNKFICNKI